MISCPYLNRLSPSTIEKKSIRLVHTALECPFMKKYKDKLEEYKFYINERSKKSADENVMKNHARLVPLSTVPISGVVANKFDFSKFFNEKIQSRIEDSTYRIFTKILRYSEKFPYAEVFTGSTRKPITVWCSNDYLALTRHPLVIEAASNAIQKHGSGSGGTRNISGNTLLHEQLEERLASYHKKEASLVFTSCFVANEATLHTLGMTIPDVRYYSDAGNHASMIHGIRTSQAPKFIFRHNDYKHLDSLLTQASGPIPKIVAFETVHSMSGQISPLGDLLKVCKKHGALSFVDEVHAIGLYGSNGAGVAEELKLGDEIDVISGTLGKAIGNIGGYVAGSRELIDMVRNYASGFIFTTSLPPSAMAGSLASLEILSSSEGRYLRKQLRHNVNLLRTYLSQEGIPFLPGSSHIIPILIGDAETCTRVSNELLERFNIYVQAINYPTVNRGESRLRVSTTPYHTEELINEFVDALLKVWSQFNLPRNPGYNFRDPKVKEIKT